MSAQTLHDATSAVRVVQEVAERLTPMARELGRELILDPCEDILTSDAVSESLRASLAIVLKGALAHGSGPVRLSSRRKTSPGADGVFDAVEVSADEIELADGDRQRAWQALRSGDEITYVSAPAGARVDILLRVSA